MKKKLHISIATHDLAASVRDYTNRIGSLPVVVIDNAYALWRTDQLNFSIRLDTSCTPGELRHLGWEDPTAVEFSAEADVNNIVWERFTASQQAHEINAAWPETDYLPIISESV